MTTPRSEDTQRIPMRFARATIVLGEPLVVGKTARGVDVSVIDRALDEVRARVEQDARA